MFWLWQAKATIEDELKDWDPAKDANVVVSLPAVLSRGLLVSRRPSALAGGVSLSDEHARIVSVPCRVIHSRHYSWGESVLTPLRRS